MSSTRARLTLDEQSFQGLLAAAFTIQEHNDRKKADLTPTAQPAQQPVSPPPVVPTCSHCGASLSSEGASCQTCNSEPLRPGERLQRNWASMWLMSQEQSLWPDREKPASSVQPKPEVRHNGHDPAPPSVSAPPWTKADRMTRIAEAVDRLGLSDRLVNEARTDASGGQASPEDLPIRDLPIRDLPTRDLPTRDHPLNHFTEARLTGNPRLDPPLIEHRANEDHVAAALSIGDHFLDYDSTTNHSTAESSVTDPFIQTIAEPDTTVDLSPHQDLAWPGTKTESVKQQEETSQPVAVDDAENQDEYQKLALASDELSAFGDTDSEADAESANRGVWDWRVKLRFHRADLYLGLAIFVALCALLWPAAAPHQPSLNPWEKMLIAMGIAEAQQPTIHYHGDPNLKVWVDTHTALYYCPGDELYGKSSDGHYTTQREAQADRFEPAEASACVQ